MPVTVGPLTTQVSSPVVQALPYDLIIGSQSMKVMWASLDFDNYVVTIWTVNAVTFIPLVIESMHGNTWMNDDYTSDRD